MATITMSRTATLANRIDHDAWTAWELVKTEKNQHARALARPLVNKALDKTRPLDERVVALECVNGILMAVVLAR